MDGGIARTEIWRVFVTIRFDPCGFFAGDVRRTTALFFVAAVDFFICEIFLRICFAMLLIEYLYTLSNGTILVPPEAVKIVILFMLIHHFLRKILSQHATDNFYSIHFACVEVDEDTVSARLVGAVWILVVK
jgi:hypothetical protein